MGRKIVKKTAARRAAASAPSTLAPNPDAISPMVMLLLGLHMAVLLFLVLALTSYTYSLDDIKKLVYYTFGSAFVGLGLLSIYLGHSPAPPKLIAWGLGGFALTLFVSTATSDYRWTGWEESQLYWAGGGMFLSAMAICSRRKTTEIFIKFLVLQLLATNIVGFLLYDFFPSDPDRNAAVYHFYYWGLRHHWFAGWPGLNTLLYTFSTQPSMEAMQSTILNRDFYAGFCTLYIPFALLIMMSPGRPAAKQGDGPLWEEDSFWRSLTPAAMIGLFFAAGYLALALLLGGTLRDFPHLSLASFLWAVFYTILTAALTLAGYLWIRFQWRPRHFQISWRFIGAVTAMMSIVCVVQCQSKGEYIFGAISCMFFLVSFYFVHDLPYLKRRTLTAVLGGIATLVATMLWMLSPLLLSRLKSIVFSVSSREIIWEGARGLFLKHPILGGGPGTFRIHFSEFRARNYFEHEISNVTEFAHNYFLDIISEEGLIGIGFFLLLLVPMLWTALVKVFRHRDPRMRVLLLAALSGLIAMFGSNLSSPNARWPIGGSALWTVMGVLAGLLIQARALEEPAETEKSRPAPLPAPSPMPTIPWERIPLLPGLMAISALIFITSTELGFRYYNSQIVFLKAYAAMDAGDKAGDAGDPPEDVEDYLKRAADGFEASIAIDPENYQSLYKLGSVYTSLANVESEMLGAQIKSKDSNETLMTRYDSAMRSYTQLALDTYQKLERIWPEYAELPYNLSMINNRIAEIKRYDARLKQAGESNGSRPETASDFTERSIDSWDDEALRYAERMYAMSQKYEVAELLGQQLMHMARTAEEAGNEQKAFDDLKQAVKVYRESSNHEPVALDQKDKYPELLRQYHDAGLLGHDPEAQGDALWKIWQSNLLDDSILDRLLDLARNSGQAALLAKTTDTLEAQNPIDPRVPRNRIALAMLDGKNADALLQFERYLKCGGKDPSAIADAAKAAKLAGREGWLSSLLASKGLSIPPPPAPAAAPAPAQKPAAPDKPA